jgi:hypothetical protein
MPSVCRQKKLAGPRNGKTHAPLVPALELPFSCLAMTSNETSPGEETLKSIYFPPPSTTHFHHFRRNRRTGISRRSSPLPEQRHRPVPQRGLDHRHQDRGHFPLSARTDESRGGQGLEMSDPQDFYGLYEIFRTMKSSDDETEEEPSLKIMTTTHARSRSWSVPKSHVPIALVPGERASPLLNPKAIQRLLHRRRPSPASQPGHLHLRLLSLLLQRRLSRLPRRTSRRRFQSIGPTTSSFWHLPQQNELPHK